MEDWKKYDKDFKQNHGVLPWGCTLYELSHRICYLRNEYNRNIHPKEVDVPQMKECIAKSDEPTENKLLAHSLLEQENIQVSSQILAKLLNKSVRTIQRMAKDGRLPASREEGNLVWMSQDLREILRLIQ